MSPMLSSITGPRKRRRQLQDALVAAHHGLEHRLGEHVKATGAARGAGSSARAPRSSATGLIAMPAESTIADGDHHAELAEHATDETAHEQERDEDRDQRDRDRDDGEADLLRAVERRGDAVPSPSRDGERYSPASRSRRRRRGLTASVRPISERLSRL